MPYNEWHKKAVLPASAAGERQDAHGFLLGNAMIDALLNESGFELGHLRLETLLCIKRAIPYQLGLDRSGRVRRRLRSHRKEEEKEVGKVSFKENF